MSFINKERYKNRGSESRIEHISKKTPKKVRTLKDIK